MRCDLGNATVTRIEELCGPSLAPNDLFSEFDAAALDQHQAWLVPEHYDAEQGRLIRSIHSWLIKTERHTVLIDTCVGNQKVRPVFRVMHDLTTPFLSRLEAAGVAPEEVDYVMCTHLHVDHVGWNTRLQDGRWIPTFPNAQYLFGRAEFAFHEAENKIVPADDGAYDDSVLPIVEAGKALLIDDGYQVDDHLRVQAAPGHTPGHVTIALTGTRDRALFTGDIMHHPLQVYFPRWNSRFCCDQDQARQTRRKVLENCADGHLLMMPTHFAGDAAGRVLRKGDGFAYVFERQN